MAKLVSISAPKNYNAREKGPEHHIKSDAQYIQKYSKLLAFVVCFTKLVLTGLDRATCTPGTLDFWSDQLGRNQRYQS